MPATVLAERVGWTGSIRWFRDNVKRLRPEHRLVDPADRLVWEPGDAGQCDLWFPPRKIPLEDGTVKLLPAGAGDHGRAFEVNARPDDPHAEDRRPAARVVGADPTARSCPAAADLGQRARHRPGAASRRRCRLVHGDSRDQARAAAPEEPGVQGCRRAVAGWRRRSCPAGCSPRRLTSTPRSPTGSPARTAEWCARPAAASNWHSGHALLGMLDNKRFWRLIVGTHHHEVDLLVVQWRVVKAVLR